MAKPPPPPPPPAGIKKKAAAPTLPLTQNFHPGQKKSEKMSEYEGMAIFHVYNSCETSE